jgi:hypothetical protein
MNILERVKSNKSDSRQDSRQMAASIKKRAKNALLMENTVVD